MKILASIFAVLLLQFSALGQQAFVKQVDTIQALKNLNSSDIYKTILVHGYHAKDDGGGGVFKWESALTTTTNTGTIFKGRVTGAELANGRWVRQGVGPWTVRHFGARGNSSTDDTAMISNAVMHASVNTGTVLFPPGTYRQSTVLLTNNVHLIGEGATIYQISIADIPANYAFNGQGSATTPKSSPAFFARRSTNIVIEGFTFTAAPTADFFGGFAGGAIFGYYVEDMVVRNCKFAFTNGWAMTVGASKRVLIDNVDFQRNVFSSGQNVTSADSNWDATYDRTNPSGIENLTLQNCVFNGTNSLARNRIFLSGVQSFSLRNITLNNVQCTRDIVAIYCGDLGLHYYGGGVATNMVFTVDNVRIKGDDGFWMAGDTLGAAISIRGLSTLAGASDPDYPELQTAFTAYGSSVRNFTVDGGTGDYGLRVGMSGVAIEKSNLKGNFLPVHIANGISDDVLLANNKFERNGVGANSGILFRPQSSTDVTNRNWTLQKNIFTGGPADPVMIWNPVLAWDNLTLRDNTWRVRSTNITGGTDSVFRLTYANRLTIDGDTISLESDTFRDTNVFDLTASATSSFFMRNVTIKSPDATLPIYAGVFTMPEGVFEANDLGSARFNFSVRGVLRRNKFASLTTTKPMVRLEGAGTTEFVENTINQTVASGQAAVFIGGGKLHSRANVTTANSSVAAILVNAGTADLESPIISNAGAGGLYTGAVNVIIRDATYPIQFYRKSGAGAVGLTVNNIWTGTSDLIIHPITDSNRNGGFGSFYTNNLTTGLQFGFGFNPTAQQFEVGTNSTTRPLWITKDGKLFFDQTVTTPGTTGAQTINKMAGRVNIAAAGTSIVVTDSFCTVNSIVLAVIASNDSTATIKNVVPGAGSFTITLNAAATAETPISFVLFN